MFLAPGTGFLEDSFSIEQGCGGDFGMIQAHYIFFFNLTFYFIFILYYSYS